MEKEHNKSLAYFLLMLPAALWVTYRMYALDITHDEAWSFHMAYKQLYENIFRTANNHWLNTFFVFLESNILGTEVWKIRIHSVLAFFLFTFYLFKIARRIPNQWIAYLLVVVLLYNTYTLDFFSLARGYALGLAFGMAALYYILYDNQKRLRIYFLLILSAASVYTQLYLLFAYGIFELAFVFKFDIFQKKKFLNYIKVLWLPILFLILATKNILFIKKSGDLSEGQANGFLEDTLGVFIQRSYEPLLSLNMASIIALILIIILLVCIILPKKLFMSTASKQLATLLIIAFLLHEFFFYVLNIPYPFGRTALYFTIPCTLCIGLFVGELKLGKIAITIRLTLLTLIALCNVYYMIQIKNLHSTNEWWMGQGMSDAIKKIKHIEKRSLDDLSILFYEGHNGVYQNYYLQIPASKLIRNFSNLHPFSLEADFKAIDQNPNTFDYILLPDYDSVIKATLQFKQYDSVAYYTDMKTWLLQKKH